MTDLIDRNLLLEKLKENYEDCQNGQGGDTAAGWNRAIDKAIEIVKQG